MGNKPLATLEKGPAGQFSMFIPGQPEPMPRPKVSRIPYPHAYYPGKRNCSWKTWAESIRIHAKYMGRLPLDRWDAVSLKVIFIIQPPDGLAKKRRGYLVPKKPDLDNYVKLVMDQLTRVGVFKDDNVVAHLDAKKLYAKEGETPGMWLRLEVLKQD